jgi:hypothetical protein
MVQKNIAILPFLAAVQRARLGKAIQTYGKNRFHQSAHLAERAKNGPGPDRRAI